jgi:hypothetical protein
MVMRCNGERWTGVWRCAAKDTGPMAMGAQILVDHVCPTEECDGRSLVWTCWELEYTSISCNLDADDSDRGLACTLHNGGGCDIFAEGRGRVCGHGPWRAIASKASMAGQATVAGMSSIAN